MKTYLFFLSVLIFSAIILLPACARPNKQADVKFNYQATDLYTLRIEELYDSLNHPWGITWYVPENKRFTEIPLLIAERNGKVWVLLENVAKQIVNLPEDVYQSGQGGWFDLIQGHEGTVYLSYARGTRNANATAVISFELNENEMFGEETTVSATSLRYVYEMNRKAASTLHFGGMMSFGQDSNKNRVLFLGLGERGQRYEAQKSNSDHGNIVAISLSDIATYATISFGHRNPQGLYYDEQRGVLYETEHGPKGGDEFNYIKIGEESIPNYGWPVVSYGKEYSTGRQVGEGTSKPGMEEPLYYWAESPALSGLTGYYGSMFSKWKGDMLASSLKNQQIYRIKLNVSGTKVLELEPLLKKKLGRIRSIKVGPDGAIYFITDENKGRLFRITREGEE